jgi:hypothetical protein
MRLRIELSPALKSCLQLALSMLLLLLACDRTPEPTPRFMGADPAVLAAEGESRAGVIREGSEGEAALFGGINAEGAASDVKLYNSKVQFIIQDAVRSHGLMDVGGGIIDADLVRPQGVLGRDTVEDIFSGLGLSRVFEPSAVEVLADGSDGGAAVVCVRAEDVGWDMMQGLFELGEPTMEPQNLELLTTYELPPDSYTLTLRSVLTNAGDETQVFKFQEGVIVSGEDMRPWAPGYGYEGTQGALPMLGFTGLQGEATLSLWNADDSMEPSTLTDLASDLGLAFAVFQETALAPGESIEVVRYLSVTPDIAAAESERLGTQGLSLSPVTGVVTSGGAGLPGVRVHFVDAQDQVGGFAMTDDQGAYSANLAPGDWRAFAVASAGSEQVPLPLGAGRYGPFAAESLNQAQLDVLSGKAQASPLAYATGIATPEPQSFSLADSATVDFELPVASGVRVEVVDQDGVPLPAVVSLEWVGALQSTVPNGLRKAIGEPNGSRAAWGWTGGEVLELAAPPGTFSLKVNHSWRYSQAQVAELTVLEGEITTLQVTLHERVERDGWLAMDPHLHGAPSFDGALPMEDRLITCAATGVDLPVTTDHDRQVEYRTLAQALDLDQRMHITPGVEVTTIVRGHFNLYPVEPALNLINGGAEAWWYAPDNTEDLFERMRETGGPEALMQINHPRSPGMFAFSKYNAENGAPVRPELWSWDFELFELLNGGVEGLDEIREDWFSFLNQGRMKVPVGASDSHYRYIPCGLGHTDVFLDETDPSQVSDTQLRQALLDGHVVVASGLTLRVEMQSEAGTAIPGDLLVGAQATLHVTLQAPEYVVPETLVLYRNGEVIDEIELPASAQDSLWFEQDFALEPGQDAWYAVEVTSTVSQGSAWRDQAPYAMSNAIRLDVDGKGWEPPGL